MAHSHQPIVDPPVPYADSIPDGALQQGRMVRIQGVVSPSADRFNINLQTGPKGSPQRDNTALHLSVRLNQGYIARNSYVDGTWGDEQGTGSLPIAAGERFEIIILCDERDYKIAINGQHFCEFPHRIANNLVSHLLVDGDVFLTLISWEGCNPAVGGDEDMSAARAATTAAASPPMQGGGYYGGQQQGGYGGQPPPQGYGPPPPQGYGPPPPQGYGPPQQGYYGQPGYGPPPPPPGGQPESGLDNFLESAQSVLAGAIASGAAEKLLGNILHSGQNQASPTGGYATQNAQYGQYPHAPPQQQQQQSGFNLSQLTGDGGSIGGLGSVGSLLSSLAGQVLQGPRNPGGSSRPYNN